MLAAVIEALTMTENDLAAVGRFGDGEQSFTATWAAKANVSVLQTPERPTNVASDHWLGFYGNGTSAEEVRDLTIFFSIDWNSIRPSPPDASEFGLASCLYLN